MTIKENCLSLECYSHISITEEDCQPYIEAESFRSLFLLCFLIVNRIAISTSPSVVVLPNNILNMLPFLSIGQP